MVDMGSSKDKWTCPNDRQLALRAKLQTGWSVKTHSLQSLAKKPEALNVQEKQTILEVIQRAESLEKVEQQRIGYTLLYLFKENALRKCDNCIIA